MKVLIAGGTGLIGSFLLKALDADSQVESILAITRSPQENFGKIQWRVADLGDESALTELAKNCDVAISCLGTTMKKAGSKEAFEKVDYHYVLNLAQAAKKAGIQTFRVVSAVGANAQSSIYYNSVKGKMERAIRALQFEDLCIFQPSLLLGPRSEFRFGEKLGTWLMPLFSFMLVGKARKNRPIQAEIVAQAIAASLFNSPKGDVVQYDEMKGLV